MTLEDDIAPDPDFPSGEWVGYYRDHGSNHRQEMHLIFRGGRISGSGADDIGAFAIDGGYDAERREAWWTKTYPGSHDVYYRGYRELEGIWGLWEIPPSGKDGFRIWPRAHGNGAQAQTAAEATEERHRALPVTAPAG